MLERKIQELDHRVQLLETELRHLRQQIGERENAGTGTGKQVELDAELDRFFETLGLKSELTGLAHLRALQAEHERVRAKARKNTKSRAGATSPSRRNARAG
jgi:hypothetical protein